MKAEANYEWAKAVEAEFGDIEINATSSGGCVLGNGMAFRYPSLPAISSAVGS